MKKIQSFRQLNVAQSHEVRKKLIAESSTFVGESDGEGSNRQVVTLGLETELISDPGQSELLAFGRNPVRGSLSSVAHTGLVVLAVSVLAVAGAVAADLFLGVGFVAGGVVRSSVAK